MKRMKKKLFIFSILIIASFSVYFYVVMPMLDDTDETADEPSQNEQIAETEDEEADEEHEQEDDAEEADTITEKVRLVIVDEVKKALDFLFDQETHIVAIGDSLTEGVGDQTERGGYVGVLDRTFNKDETIVHFDNHGKSGIRTDQLLKRLNLSKITTSIEEADIVLITIGGNDIIQVLKDNIANLTYEQFASEQEHYEERLQKIFDKVRKYNKNAHIYVLGLYNPFREYFQDIEELDLIVDDWNESSKSLAEEYPNITFVPIKDIFTGNEDEVLADDNFHPNELGYYRIADRVLDYFSKKERWVP